MATERREGETVCRQGGQRGKDLERGRGVCTRDSGLSRLLSHNPP